MSAEDISLVWFRDDLRLSANPALKAAADAGKPILCFYLFNENDEQPRLLGGAKRWWLDKSLRALSEKIENLGGKLFLKRNTDRSTADVLLDVCRTHNVKSVFWNRRYSTSETDIDKSVKSVLSEAGHSPSSFSGSLLKEPWEVKTNSGNPYKVFTPFWNALKPDFAPKHPDGIPDCSFFSDFDCEDLEDWALHPSKPDWSDGLGDAWIPGEDGAKACLEAFFDEGLKGYKEKRDRPDLPNTSRLSPYLSFGEISVHEIWSRTLQKISGASELESDGWAFLRELAWRDFSYSLLFQSKDLSTENWNDKFDGFPWEKNETCLTAWQKGQTGYPIVDAGMRELWTTGWMHNRVRMIVASFLIKHLMIDWRTGEEWFWDTLVDADTANNPASWQWVAGSGADASPYFRIFNPITQGEKFDPDGVYIRKWVPELSKLPRKCLFAPWDTPRDVQKECGVLIGHDYPKPIVIHKQARQRALDAYESLKT
ncbi:MAG TPA: deoxyribodipyrimidine photolyase [Hyphomonadaceae bacterium]|nr:deoxyribodipyrimidine photo-lyase [Ponticaulis sp.]MAJ08223.1 deoxyribodipyrimidine photolyase [Ponticaulis sp.]HBJ94078.1 deoxyribodipyrimidine photolyase [Hyphomonadaceae bacterium]